MSLIFLADGSIGAEIVNMTNDLIAYLQQLRTQSTFHRFALLLPLLAVRIFKAMVVAPFIIGMSRWKAYWIPYYREGYHEMLIHSIPNNLRCYNKIGLLVFLVDFYCALMCVYRATQSRIFTYVYLLLKFITLATPFMAFSPLERKPFWALGLALMLLEMPCVFLVIQCVGRGADFKSGNFYKDLGWKKHYHYRRMSTNRKFTLEFSFYAYPPFKLTFFTSFMCYNKDTAKMRLKFPHIPSPADLLDLFHPGATAKSWHLREGPATAVADYALSGPVSLPSLEYLTALTEPDTAVNLRYGVLFLLALSSLSVYSIILAGWASNSKYAFIGALRSAAQMISYEVAISLILLPVILMAGSLNLSMITYMQSITIWFVFPLLPVSVLFLIAMLAETNRTPFDLPEAEAELVAGYNVDYSSLPFAMFFLAEYCNMILISTLFCLLFLGGGLNTLGLNSSFVLALKASVIWIFFVNVRATLPRYRYDQLMDIGWKVFLPIAGGFLVFIFGLLVLFDAVPYTTELPFDVWNLTPFDEEAHYRGRQRLEPTPLDGPFWHAQELRHVNPLSASLFILCRALNFTGWSLSAPTLIPPTTTYPALFSDSATVAFFHAKAIRASASVVDCRQFFNQEICTKRAATSSTLLPNCLVSNTTNYGKAMLLLSPREAPANFFDPRDNVFFFTVFFATFWLWVVVIRPWYLAGGYITVRFFWLELQKALRWLLAPSSIFRLLWSQAILSTAAVYSYLQRGLHFLLLCCRQYRNNVLLSRLYGILLLYAIVTGTTILWIVITIAFVCSCCWNILHLTLLLTWYAGCAVFAYSLRQIGAFLTAAVLSNLYAVAYIIALCVYWRSAVFYKSPLLKRKKNTRRWHK